MFELVQELRLPPGEVARAALILMALGIGAYVLWRVQEVLFLLFLAILLATAIEPLVNRLRRGPFTRGTGVLVVYTAIVLAIGLPAYALIPSVASQAGAFTESLPERLLALRPYALELQPRLLQGMAVGTLDTTLRALQAPQQPDQVQIVEAGATALHTVLAFLTVFVLAFYWLLERASIKRVLLRSVPTHYARNVNTVWMEVEEKLGGWVRGQLLLMLAVGVAATIAFVLIGLPNPVLLGVVAGLFEIVPMLGPFLAFAPAVLVALAIDPAKALVVLIVAVIIQQIESNILLPRVMGRTVGVSPLTVLLGILIGSILAGLPGAFVAVPIAGAIQVILAHLLGVEDPNQAEEHGPSASYNSHESDGRRDARDGGADAGDACHDGRLGRRSEQHGPETAVSESSATVSTPVSGVEARPT